MVKMRMTTADVAAEVSCLRKLIGMRCANIYDLTPRTYVIKLAKSSGLAESGESEKVLVLLESGVRLHTTVFSRDKSSTPSGFTLKLRKHIRTRRLEDVRQLGIDRVVDFQFGLGDSAHHIILELYAQGNVLLTDGNYSVLTLLRSHRDDDKGVTMMARHRYPINTCRLFSRTSSEKIRQSLESGSPEQEGPVELKEKDNSEGNIDKRGKKGEAKGGRGTLKALLSESLGYGPALTEHILLTGGLQGNMDRSLPDDSFDALVSAVVRFEDWLENVVKGLIVPEGYIFMKKKENTRKKHSFAVEEGDELQKLYDEFAPLPLQQLADRERSMYGSFDAAMDDFFSKIEGQRAEQQRLSQENSAFSKLEKIRADQSNRVQALKKEVDQSVRMAELVEYNLDEVDAAIGAVRSALASGMDWKDLARMIKDEKKAGNPVAGSIHSLQLDKNQITLLLSNNLDDMGEDEKTTPADKVEIDLALSAHANARKWFEMKKKHAVKQEKTEAAHEKAFKAAERKTQQQLAQAKSVAAISHLRKVHWFEKFNWFVSSENYLVISGRDAQQNELVVKRYMKKGDIYVHAELHGASSTVIKNHEPSRSIPPLTINQAGSFTVCRSQAWDSKIVTSAWWVYDHQVSKTAPTGEYLTVGSFMVRGAKNFLPPHPLVMGFGLLFRFDESSIGSHLNERRIRGEAEGENEDNEIAEDEDERSSSHMNTRKTLRKGEEDLVVDAGRYLVDHDEGGELDEEASADEEGTLTEGEKSNVEVVDERHERNEPALDEEISAVEPAGDDGSDTSEEESSTLDDLLDKALELRAVPKPASHVTKYGLDTHQPAEPTPADTDSKFVQRDRPYLSKAERRRLKKTGKAVEVEASVATEQDDPADQVEDEQDVSASAKNARGSDGQGKPVRGKKGKMKKIKEKYDDQDEEERQLKKSLFKSVGRKEEMSLAGGKKGKVLQGNRKPAGTVVEEDSKICYKCKKSGHVARDCLTEISEGTRHVVETESSKAIGSSLNKGDQASESNTDVVSQPDVVAYQGGGKVVEGLRRKARAKVAEEEIAAIQAEENIVQLSEEQRLRLTELDTLTGNPVSDDVLLYAVPVCGPYSALQQYKFRVKLTPGAAKKGKGAKTALDVFSRMPEATPREKELMKAITEPEMAAAMIGNVKVTAPGLTKMKQGQKKGKKASRKTS